MHAPTICKSKLYYKKSAGATCLSPLQDVIQSVKFPRHLQLNPRGNAYSPDACP